MTSPRKLALAGAGVLIRRLSENTVIQKTVFNAIRLNRIEINKTITNDEIKFLSYCLSRRGRSRSQILQDLWVCFELGEKTSGYFVEFGATNGVTNSNTWLLEKEFGWKGILVEPNPIWHGDLARDRWSDIEHRCVYSKSGEMISFIATDDSDPELSCIDNFSGSDHFAQTRNLGRRIQVETISLDHLLDEYEAPSQIDYMSIDTEGSELEILSSYSFSRKFRAISIENNPKNEKHIDYLLASKGYVRVFNHLSQWDSWYVAQDLRSDVSPLIYSPNS